MKEEASTYDGLKIVYSTNGVEKIGQIHIENETRSLITLHTRISKWITDFNVSSKIINILEENIGSKISDIACSNYVLSDISPQARETKEKINKWDYIQLKSFCTTKETTNKTKRQLWLV